MQTRLLLSLFVFILAAVPADAVTLQVSAAALERSLKHQAFPTPSPDGKSTRRYLRGDLTHPCSVYLDDPHISFRHGDPAPAAAPAAPVIGPNGPEIAPAPPVEDRIVVSVTTHARFGKAIKGFCLGLPITLTSTVSFIPEAQGESIGFRDARIEHISNNAELDALLEPFLAHRLPQELKINAANLLRTLLVRAPDSTGYVVTLLTLNIRTMHVESVGANQVLLVDLDADMKVD